MRQNPYASLSGKTVLVTGAGKGIGRALALALGEIGAAVVCASRTRTEIDSVVQSVRDSGSQALAVATDVTCPDQTAALASEIDGTFGGLDVAFLNAGGNLQRASIEESDVDEWKSAVELNLHSVFYGIRAVAPLMRKKGGGRIILTGSAMAHYPAVKNSSYGVGKAGARMLANTAALELMADNITVNEFIPGPTRTVQALAGTTKDNAASPFNNPSEWIKEPADVVDMMLMMAAYPGKGPTSQIFSLARR